MLHSCVLLQSMWLAKHKPSLASSIAASPDLPTIGFKCVGSENLMMKLLDLGDAEVKDST